MNFKLVWALTIALALAFAAPSAHAAEIFATNNTAVITDPADPRLKDPLIGFERQVDRLIEQGGGKPRGSELLDGVFASDEGTTFERSRRFDVARVDDAELHTIANAIRERFAQQSVLTFDRGGAADAVELEVPGVSAQALRDGLLADQEAREHLFGGSVTQDRHLLLVAGRADEPLAVAFAKRIGGDMKHAKARYGEREFVEGPLPVRVEHRTLLIDGAPVITRQGAKLAVAVAGQTFRVRLCDIDRVRVNGSGALTFNGGGRVDVRPAGDRARIDAGDLRIETDGIEVLKLNTGAGEDALSVADLSGTGVYEVDADLGAGTDRATVLGSEDLDQISVGAFGVLGPTYVRFLDPEHDDQLTVDGRGGDDIVSASTDMMRLTLAGGSGTNTLIGGPGDDRLIGGPGTDDVTGGKGDDVALMGGGFDRFKWSSGDGADVVDGGASFDSIFVQGSNDANAFDLRRDGLTVDGLALSLSGIEEIDTVAGGGADTFNVGDTGAKLVDISLAGLPILPGGDGQADRVTVAGAGQMKLAGKVVVAGTATLTGLPATVTVSHAEPRDTLAVHGGSVDTSAFDPATIGLELS
jgi:Ca2+-binding RTX toxin-like protein